MMTVVGRPQGSAVTTQQHDTLMTPITRAALRISHDHTKTRLAELSRWVARVISLPLGINRPKEVAQMAKLYS